MQEKNAQACDLLFGHRLKICLKANKISQKDAANSLGIGENTLLNYVKNRRIPDACLALKISQMCDVSLEWLISGECDVDIVKMWNEIISMPDNNRVTFANEMALPDAYVTAVLEGNIVPSMRVMNQFYSRYDVIPVGKKPDSIAHHDTVWIDIDKKVDSKKNKENVVAELQSSAETIAEMRGEIKALRRELDRMHEINSRLKQP